MLQLDEHGNCKALVSLISQQIRESICDRISFAEYMELVLYHPQYGYYATAPSKIGTQGDFFTSPHLGAEFGELIAEQLLQMWQLLEYPHPFTVVEMGAGQGLLASDILNYLVHRASDLFKGLDYRIVERAPALIAEQKHQLKPLQERGAQIRWSDLAAIAPESVTGCFLSNELVDALPVHQVIVESGQLQEVYVTLAEPAADDRPFTEVSGELSTPQLAEYFEQLGVDLMASRYPDRYQTEVNLAALDWMAAVANRLQRGYVLTIDYGYSSERYYHPVRSQGTLQCYYQHRHHSDPYRYVGQQDITAHVNFTALQKQGERWGLDTLGLTKQGLFLMGLGLGDRIATLSQSTSTDAKTIQDILLRRDALQRLVDPMGLGNFGVLIQSKGVPTDQLLQGLAGERL
ncbi:class I SAM-dependent methyltransferase [Leptodesmis sp.]|uniref:class I SAM-dependent methyltransferase n=1 Tax=Leptodesmis sp. TaxID=3100501 RepID=UPI0040535034